jgi:hypothetical protein
MLLSIDEEKRYKDPRILAKEHKTKELEDQDNYIFDRARLINCHHFMQVFSFLYSLKSEVAVKPLGHHYRLHWRHFRSYKGRE